MSPPQDLWNDPQGLILYYHTHAIPIHPRAGVVIASIVCSIFGSYATLLVLGRRTSSRGWRNHGLLVLAAICFAAVAVWGMHFVSMNSIRLQASPEVTWYLEFSRGFTSMSLFVPLLATAFAFWFIGSENDFRMWRVVVAGVFVGLTIGLMHYSASFQLPYLMVSYTTVTVVFALILACVAATAAFTAFFKFRVQWQDSFWKRSLCSIFLATAVCGMHYLGLGGTSYRSKLITTPSDLVNGQHQSQRLTIVIAALCGVIIILSIVAAILDALTRREMRNRARHIVVASATFDEFGKILVKHDGTIPMQMIETEADLNRVLAEIDPRQSVFQWLYQLSFNWHLVRPFVPRIHQHIEARAKRKSSRAADKTSASSSDTENFRGRFLEASILLAQQLNISVEGLGYLFDRVMTTGTRVPTLEDTNEKGSRDDESSIHGITLKLQASEGVLIFLVRELGTGKPAALDYPNRDHSEVAGFDSVDHWLERGFRLTDTRFFSKTLADHMGVAKGEMDIFLSACKTYAKRGNRPVVQTRGTYLGLFGVRPTSASHGLDVMVYNFARHQIPAYRLPDVNFPLTASMRAWIRECGNLTMGEVLQRANEAIHRAETSDTGSGSIQSQDDEVLYEFQAAIGVAIESLISAMRPWPQILDMARLSSEVLDLPASNHDDEVPAQMIVLEVVLPAPEIRLTPVASRASGVQAPDLTSGRHETDKPPAPFIYTPWSLFAKSQTCLIRGKIWADMCRHMNGELTKMYPLQSADLAAEVYEEEKIGRTPAPQQSVNGPWTVGGSTLGAGFKLGHKSRPGTSESSTRLQSPDTIVGSDNFDIEKGYGLTSSSTTNLHTPMPAEKGDRPRRGTIVDADAPAKKGFSALVSKAVGTVAPSNADAEPHSRKPEPGPPIYQSLRLKTDGWHLRGMRSLERDDTDNLLDGYDWVSASKT